MKRSIRLTSFLVLLAGFVSTPSYGQQSAAAPATGSSSTTSCTNVSDAAGRDPSGAAAPVPRAPQASSDTAASTDEPARPATPPTAPPPAH